MRSRTLVFVSGPYSDNPTANTLDAARVTKWLIEKGYAVYAPHLHWHWFEAIHPHPYEVYMEQTFVALERCDLLIRLPGVSPGSDREVAHAEELGIPVLLGREGLEKWEECKP